MKLAPEWGCGGGGVHFFHPAGLGQGISNNLLSDSYFLSFIYISDTADPAAISSVSDAAPESYPVQYSVRHVSLKH